MCRPGNRPRRLRALLETESGFGLIELVLASGVFMLVMASLSYLGTVAFADVAVARQRQTATALANEALERVRALPYDTVGLGLGTSDLQSSGDSAVVFDGTSYRFGGERIPNGNNATISPLVPHRVTQAVDDTSYTTSVYVTYLDDDSSSRAYRITAVVAWLSTLRQGVAKQVEAQTVIWSPSGTSPCQSTSTHPFAAPCQPFLYATSTVSPGGIFVSPGTAGAPAVAGVDLESASMWLPSESSYAQIEQVSAVQATVTTSGVSFRRVGETTDTSAGSQTVSVGSDNDPTQPKPEHATASTAVQASQNLTLSGGDNSIVLSSASADTATATATVAASALNSCTNAAFPPVSQLDGLPCGNATTEQGGSSSIVVNLGSLGAVTVSSIAAPGTTSAAHTNRDLAPQATSCAATSGAGCIHSSHRRNIGSVRVASLPSSMAALAPAGFDYLVKLDNFSNTVSAEAGIGNASPSVTRTGTIEYWNGVGYTTITLGAGAVNVPLAPITVSDAVTSTTIQLGGTMSTGPTSMPACPSPCASATAESQSPLLGDLFYTVVVGGVPVLDLLIHIDFGTLTSSASYTPSA